MQSILVIVTPPLWTFCRWESGVLGSSLALGFGQVPFSLEPLFLHLVCRQARVLLDLSQGEAATKEEGHRVLQLLRGLLQRGQATCVHAELTLPKLGTAHHQIWQSPDLYICKGKATGHTGEMISS